MTISKKQISEVMSKLGKLARKKHPKPKSYYRDLQKKSVEARKKKKLSPTLKK